MRSTNEENNDMHARNHKTGGGRLLAAAGIVLASALLSPAARAGGPEPGSLLLYGEFDNQNGVVTMLNVTNASPTDSVKLHWVFIEESNCLEYDRTWELTPKDTFTFLTNFFNPQQDRGYVYVYAVDDAGQAISFNHLIGTAVKLDGLSFYEYGLDAMSFQALASEGLPTEIDQDGVRDLNGLEYTQTPDELLIPRFLGQSSIYSSELVLINLTGGGQFDASVGFLISNDNEEIFSAQHTFRCWTKEPLLNISGVFDQDFLANLTNHDPNEVLGANLIESGWFELDGLTAASPAATFPDPAIVGYLVETAGGDWSGADLPFGRGLQSNGGLLQIGTDPNRPVTEPDPEAGAAERGQHP